MRKDSENTYKLLYLISKHLSGRQDCKRVQYVVTISQSKEVNMDPIIYVFPNVYNRKDTDKKSLIHHIHDYHDVEFDKLVEGKYMYQLSEIGGKVRRRWTNLEESL